MSVVTAGMAALSALYQQRTGRRPPRLPMQVNLGFKRPARSLLLGCNNRWSCPFLGKNLYK